MHDVESLSLIAVGISEFTGTVNIGSRNVPWCKICEMHLNEIGDVFAGEIGLKSSIDGVENGIVIVDKGGRAGSFG